VQDGSSVALRDHRLATNLYRIAQEAVTNSVKHADAQTITIRIQTNSGLTTLRVSDDGRGIDDAATDADGVGLRIMNYSRPIHRRDVDVRVASAWWHHGDVCRPRSPALSKDARPCFLTRTRRPASSWSRTIRSCASASADARRGALAGYLR
jgi:hypothetical protein